MLFFFTSTISDTLKVTGSSDRNDTVEAKKETSSRVSDDVVLIVLGMVLAVLVLAIAVGTFFLLSRMWFTS